MDYQNIFMVGALAGSVGIIGHLYMADFRVSRRSTQEYLECIGEHEPEIAREEAERFVSEEAGNPLRFSIPEVMGKISAAKGYLRRI